mgnify:CR=1 FL=1
MNYEEYLWGLVFKFVEDLRRVDKKIIRRGEPVAPTVVGFGYCPRCRRLVTSIGVLNVGLETIRVIFPLTVITAFKGAKRCGKCGGETLPVGYAFTSLAWALLNLDKYSKEEVESYFGTIGSVEQHPKKVEVYSTLIVTVMGVKQIIEKVFRKGSKVRFRKVKMPEAAKATGRFVLPLPEIDVNKTLGEIEKAFGKAS